MIGPVSVWWLKVWLSVLTDRQIGGSFEVDQVVVDGFVDATGVGLEGIVGGVTVALRDEEHAAFEVLGEISAGFERGSDVAGGADNENGWSAGPSERWRRICFGRPHITRVGFLGFERAEARSDGEQLVDHALGRRRGGSRLIKT